MHTSRIAAALVAASLASGAHAALTVSTFDDLPLSAGSHFFPGTSTEFVSGAASFNHDFTDWGWGCCWSGWTYSNQTDTTTPGFENQFSAYAGSGAGGSANYALAYMGSPMIRFEAPAELVSVDVSNTTYAALSMLQGDSFAKKFGGDSGNDADFLKLTFIGLNAANQETGRVDFYLADYRFADNSLDYVIDSWASVNLSSLGTVAALKFELSSSDNGDFGMNTPAYFAIDNLAVTAVPEASSLAMMLVGLVGVVGATALRRRSLR
jgi:hypothetical protein